MEPNFLIEVENLTKYYGNFLALDNLSFKVRSGEVVGFLGPNGAGKTTAMRIMTGFFPPTEGRAVIAGRDVFTHPQEVKRNVGYLPEAPPLYPELRVTDYLAFVAGLRLIPKEQRPKRIEEVMEKCGLEEKQKAYIGTLSKGYRQRVGLAQAIIHDPPILILDEPTSALDPRQVVEIRNLIRSLAGEHTIVLSTHILTEVSQVCERVLILNRGKLIAEDTPENLSRELAEAKRFYLELEAPLEAVMDELGKIQGIVRIEDQSSKDGVVRLLIYVEPQEEIRRELINRVAQNNWLLKELRPDDLTLEEIFLRIVQEEEQSLVTD